jgi:hypothetical protein
MLVYLRALQISLVSYHSIRATYSWTWLRGMDDGSITGYSYTKRQVRPDNKNNNKRISDRENWVAVSWRRFGMSVSSADVMQGLSYAQCAGCSRKDQLNLVELLTLVCHFMLAMSRTVRWFYRIYSNNSSIQGDTNNHRRHRDKSLKTKKTFHNICLHSNYKFYDTNLLYVHGIRFNHFIPF